MISITVRQHKSHCAPPAGLQINQQANENRQQQITCATAAHHQNNQNSYHVRSHSSNVEVQYLARRLVPHTSTTLDLNNNNNNIQHVHTAHNQCLGDQQQQKLEQQQAPAARAGPQKNHLHSRSISLVINPEFASSSDTTGLCRRRCVVPRRSRNLPRPEQKDDKTMATSGGVHLLSSHHNRNSQGQSASAGQQSSELELTSSSETELELHYSASLGQQVHHETDVDESSTQGVTLESFERLRRTGIFLREISDEFFRSRRRTI